MKRSKRYYQFAVPFLMVMAGVFLVLAYMNMKAMRFPEGMITLAASIMIMVQAVGVLVCKKIDEAVETMKSQNNWRLSQTARTRFGKPQLQRSPEKDD